MSVINCIELTSSHTLVTVEILLHKLQLLTEANGLCILQTKEMRLPLAPLTLPLPPCLSAHIIYHPIYLAGTDAEGLIADLPLAACITLLQQLCDQEGQRHSEIMELEQVGEQGLVDADMAEEDDRMEGGEDDEEDGGGEERGLSEGEDDEEEEEDGGEGGEDGGEETAAADELVHDDAVEDANENEDDTEDMEADGEVEDEPLEDDDDDDPDDDEVEEDEDCVDL